MSKTNALMNIQGAMELIKRSGYPLTPLFEGITNSLESLSQRGVQDDGQIVISLFFKVLTTQERRLEEVSIQDNGVGFTKENYLRFREFFDKSKGFHNRGTGRLQYLHAFEDIQVESVFDEGGKCFRRRIGCNSTVFIYDDVLTEISEERPSTIVRLKQYKGGESDGQLLNGITIDDLLVSIKRHFILRFFLDSQKENFQVPKIVIKFIVGSNEERRVISPDDIVQPEKTGFIRVPYKKIRDPNSDRADWKKVEGKDEEIKWAHFALPADDVVKNGIYLCSKDVPVQAVKFDAIGRDESFNGKRYITAFYGQIFDDPDNVSHSVDAFTLPDKKETEKLFNNKDMWFDPEEEFLFLDTVEEEVGNAIPGIYEGVLQAQEEHASQVAEISKAHGIPLDVAAVARIKLSDDEKTITRKLYRAQSERLADRGYAAKKIYESLNSLNPTEEKYQDELKEKVSELSDIVDDQNKEELSKYVIRREMVKEVLGRILNSNLDYQNENLVKGVKRDKEGLVHDLLFKRKKKGGLNDLWIIDEEFLHFFGCSDLPLDSIELPDGRRLIGEIDEGVKNEYGIILKKRPDIYLFADEGKCLIIELKAPDVDLGDHLNQMTKYCTLIANYGVVPATKFYCYLIGNSLNPHVDLDGDWYETVNGDWVRDEKRIMSVAKKREAIAFQRLEIIKLSNIHERAHRRNMSFAEQLGLPELLR